MIPVKEAIGIAQQALSELFDSPQRVEIEEYAIDSNRRHWLVTLSYTASSEDANELASLIPVKKWKTFSVDAETGEITYMIAGAAGEILR